MYPDTWRTEALSRAAASGGACVVPLTEASALLWAGGNDVSLGAVLEQHENIRWVQLPNAGVDKHSATLVLDTIFTCAKGAYALPVAQHAMALLLACTNQVLHAGGQAPMALHGATALVFGAGAIGQRVGSILSLLGCRVRFIRRHRPSGSDVSPQPTFSELLREANILVLCAPLTAATRAIIDAVALRSMPEEAVLVNVSRGGLVVTNDLVDVLRERPRFFAGLDVTDPEPLAEDHPLHALPNCILTPHVANPGSEEMRYLGPFVRENVRRWIEGLPLQGVVDRGEGY